MGKYSTSSPSSGNLTRIPPMILSVSSSSACAQMNNIKNQRCHHYHTINTTPLSPTVVTVDLLTWHPAESDFVYWGVRGWYWHHWKRFKAEMLWKPKSTDSSKDSIETRIIEIQWLTTQRNIHRWYIWFTLSKQKGSLLTATHIICLLPTFHNIPQYWDGLHPQPSYIEMGCIPNLAILRWVVLAEAVHTITLIQDIWLIHQIFCLVTLCTQLLRASPAYPHSKPHPT